QGNARPRGPQHTRRVADRLAQQEGASAATARRPAVSPCRRGADGRRSAPPPRACTGTGGVIGETTGRTGAASTAPTAERAPHAGPPRAGRAPPHPPAAGGAGPAGITARAAPA